MALNTSINDLARQLSSSLGSGGSLTGSLPSGAAAFGWGDLVPTIADFVETYSTPGMSVNIQKITESGTPAGVVAPGGPKPAAATLTAETVAVVKHAGKAVANLESFVDARNLADAITRVLSHSCLKSFETAAVAELAADAGQSVTTATDWAGAIATAQGMVLAAGGRPSVVVVSPTDYSAMLADLLPLGGISAAEGIPGSSLQVLGSALHVSTGAPTGFAYVLDKTAVQAVQNDKGLLVLLDPYSGSGSNVVTLVCDLLATAFVTGPDGVVKITAPAAAGTGATRTKGK